MNTRHSIVTLAAGAALALGATVAQAHVSQGTRIAPEGTFRSNAYSAANLKAQELRWKAVADSYLSHFRAQTSQHPRPDDRPGARGVLG